uniref:Immunoglobulin V-set domain-containing protein n=1 Tax=Maylandia zebra TaxID=106582 RepID=A0A3P9BFX1_9CICH
LVVILLLFCRLVLFVALRCVTSAVEVIHVTGYVGREVNVSCSYDEGYESYEKYLCKNDCGSDDDVLIKTSESRKNKYRISDEKTARIVTATIYDLRSVDAGKYWCGVSRTGIDIYTEVDCCNSVTKIESYAGYSVSFSCPYQSQYQNNLKYICRGTRPSMCLQQALITSKKKKIGRFSMLTQFTTKISSLTQSDSGRYLCGIQRNSDLHLFYAFELKVKGERTKRGFFPPTVFLQHTSTVPSTVKTPGKTVSSTVRTPRKTVPSTVKTPRKTVPSTVKTPGKTIFYSKNSWKNCTFYSKNSWKNCTFYSKNSWKNCTFYSKNSWKNCTFYSRKSCKNFYNENSWKSSNTNSWSTC